MKKHVIYVMTAVFALSAVLTACKKDKDDKVSNDATIPVTGVTLDEETLTLSVDGTATLTATVLPEDATNKDVTWASDNPDIATVDNGTVTAKAEGTATITVTTVDGNKTATCVVTVSHDVIPVTGVTLDQETLTLSIDGTATLAATVLPEDATNKDVTWASDNPDIATVDNGTVTAKAAGTATITVTTVDGNKSATCTLTVQEGVVINGVRWATRNLGTGGQFVAKPEDYGALFQWGRRADGHENRTSLAYPTNDESWENGVVNVSELDAYGQIPTTHAAYGKFVKQAEFPYDWRTPQDDNLWGAVKTANDPSPVGWRVPTIEEFHSLADETYVTSEWTSENGINGYRFTDKATGNALFLPAAGDRNYPSGALNGAGAGGYYWSSSVTGVGAYGLYFNSGAVVPSSTTRRAEGFSVRCVADE